MRGRAVASITELDEGDLSDNTQPLFPICKRYMYECTCIYVLLGTEPRSLCWTSVLSLKTQPCKVNFLSRTSDLDKQFFLCCSLNLVFN